MYDSHRVNILRTIKHYVEYFFKNLVFPLNSSMIICIVQKIMSQPKVQLELPLKLTLQHFLQTTSLRSADGELASKVGSARVILRLKAMVPDGNTQYEGSFVMNFLLIKLNSWLTFSSFASQDFISQLVRYYNDFQENAFSIFRHSRNDGELMAQILLESQAYEWLREEDLEEVLEGNALVGATAVQALRQGQWLMKQSYFAIVLGLVGLHGRTDPYIPIVQKDKNHLGQIEFAKRIETLMPLNPNIKKLNLDIIQDAYSLRCTPQVHGVTNEALQNLASVLEGLINRPQTRYIVVKGKRMRNLALRAESETMLLDQLIMGLNQLGHMSFLRAQRILNRHLGKSDISNSEHYEYLRILLKKYSYFVSENKLLAIPSSIDTILMLEYKHDIYVHEGTAKNRLSTIFLNLKYLFKLEVMAALEVISSVYANEGTLFLNEEMEAVYSGLASFRTTDSIQYGKAIEKWLKI